MAMPNNSRNMAVTTETQRPRLHRRISNTGAQRVEAPIDPNGKRGKEIIKRGNDLRTGNGK